jgi:Fic family protein
MKPRTKAPTFDEARKGIEGDPDKGRMSAVFEKLLQLGPPGDEYIHRRRTPPAGFSVLEWWFVIKLSRRGQLKLLPLWDAQGVPFRFASASEVQEMLHQIDQRAAGTVALPEGVSNREESERYVVNSLMEEAITSSQLEGASSTRQVAAEMLRSGRRPIDHSERMIRNNYDAIRFVKRISNRPLTADDVLELHRITTTGTLRNESAAGRLQTSADTRVMVLDNATQEVLFHPPPAEQLPQRMAAMIRFANGETPSGKFLHPVIRAIMLHFWLAYDHPFDDGNGRTARALFYWAMLRNGYWLFEYASISTILRQESAQYRDAYLQTESDENDATYFILHQLRLMLRAIDAVDDYLKRKAAQVKDVERRLRNAALYNHRQLALLGHALRHPGATYTVRSHQGSHEVAYATARADLLKLRRARLLELAGQRGRAEVYRVPADLESRLGGADPQAASGNRRK